MMNRKNEKLPGYIRARIVQKKIDRKLFLRKVLQITACVCLALVVTFGATPFGKALIAEWTDKTWAMPIVSAARNSSLSIQFISVGKADSILIQCEGETLLLDGATYDKCHIVSDYFAKLGVSSLDYVIASHPDMDHIGGLQPIIEETPVRNFLYGEMSQAVLDEAQSFKKLKEFMDTQGIPHRALAFGESISLGSALITVVSRGEQFEDSNNASLVLRLTYGDFSALFCGDIEKKAEDALLDSGQDITADFLKVAHHGSNTSTQKRFLVAVSPAFAGISTSISDDFPDQAVLQRLSRRNVEIFRTDYDGCFTISVKDGVMTGTTEQGFVVEKKEE